jgi:hypothetical protein
LRRCWGDVSACGRRSPEHGEAEVRRLEPADPAPRSGGGPEASKGAP